MLNFQQQWKENEKRERGKKKTWKPGVVKGSRRKREGLVHFVVVGQTWLPAYS